MLIKYAYIKHTINLCHEEMHIFHHFKSLKVDVMKKNVIQSYHSELPKFYFQNCNKLYYFDFIIKNKHFVFFTVQLRILIMKYGN
jgi:hypothetical protein